MTNTKIQRLAINGMEGSLEANTDPIYWLSLYFHTPEDRDAFAAKFPKSMKVRSFRCDHYDAIDRTTWHTYGAGLTITAPKNHWGVTNKTTGEANESGDKRMARFIAAVKAEMSS